MVYGQNEPSCDPLNAPMFVKTKKGNNIIYNTLLPLLQSVILTTSFYVWIDWLKNWFFLVLYELNWWSLFFVLSLLPTVLLERVLWLELFLSSKVRVTLCVLRKWCQEFLFRMWLLQNSVLFQMLKVIEANQVWNVHYTYQYAKQE